MNATATRKPLTQSRALYCLVVNQCATPGLGSIIARRYREGCCQLAIALVGFGMVMFWMVHYFAGKISRLINDLPVDENMNLLLFKFGWIVFGIAWVWAWFTSISVMREAKRNAERELKAPPLLK